jgi:hypothetical protein
LRRMSNSLYVNVELLSSMSSTEPKFLVLFRETKSTLKWDSSQAQAWGLPKAQCPLPIL